MIVFCLHYLGGSAHEWGQVAALLTRARCIALDLPGFGDAARTPGYTVAEMCDAVASAIATHAPSRYVIAGHSMGAKVAAALARRAEDGAAELAGLEGLVLVAGSPPSPEPMDDAQRKKMLARLSGGAAENRADAQAYIAENIARPLEAALTEQAVADMLRANRAAWVAWLQNGSREDWAPQVGVLRTPALVIAGSDDPKLGPDAQHMLVLPHFAHAELVTIPAAKHLLPMERPHAVTRLIDQHVHRISSEHVRSTTTTVSYDELIASERVGERTRVALRQREQPEHPGSEPRVLNAALLTCLRSVISRVIPQAEENLIDLAARIDRQLASGAGDGWRFAQLPPDAAAYRAALLTLNCAAQQEYGIDFAALAGIDQDHLLRRIATGEKTELEPMTQRVDAAPERMNAEQLRLWFDDLMADAVRAYVGHPQTLAAMGYSGIANGGDNQPKSGFARVGLGEREEWEPVAQENAAR